MVAKTLITGGNPDELISVPWKTEFEGEDFLHARQAQRVADALIEQLDEFEHLRERRLICVWARDGGKKDGKAVWGKCVKAPGLVRLFGECDWVIALAANCCRFMTAFQFEALIYQQLCRAGEDEEVDDVTGAVIKTMRLNAWDVEGFAAEITRYGAWRGELKLIGAAYQQAPMFDDEPTPMRKSA